MLDWIKKRCSRRRSCPMGVKLEDSEAECPLYFTLENGQDKNNSGFDNDHIYEDISDVNENRPSRNITRDIKMTEKINIESNNSSSGMSKNTCPLCRRRQFTQACLWCCIRLDDTIPNWDSKNLGEPAKSPFEHCISNKTERRHSDAFETMLRPLPKIPQKSSSSDTASENESSGYESIGSDSGSETQVYSDYESVLINHINDDFCCMLPEESDYEEIDVTPKQTTKRRFSLGSSFGIQNHQKHKIILESTVGKGRQLSPRRTITRRGSTFKFGKRTKFLSK